MSSVVLYCFLYCFDIFNATNPDSRCSIEDLDLFRPVTCFVKKNGTFSLEASRYFIQLMEIWGGVGNKFLLSAGKIGMDWEYTPRKFNMKIGLPKRRLIFQPSFFSGYVKLREYNL